MERMFGIIRNGFTNASHYREAQGKGNLKGLHTTIRFSKIFLLQQFFVFYIYVWLWKKMTKIISQFSKLKKSWFFCFGFDKISIYDMTFWPLFDHKIHQTQSTWGHIIIFSPAIVPVIHLTGPLSQEDAVMRVRVKVRVVQGSRCLVAGGEG